MIPVQISIDVEGKHWQATLRCVMGSRELVKTAEGYGEKEDSRQRMELQAVLAGLKRMLKPSEITIKAGGYIKTGFEYMRDWESAGWRKRNGKPVANADLWKQVAEEAHKHKITIFLI